MLVRTRVNLLQLRPAFAPLAGALAQRHGLDPEDLEQEVWLRALERAAQGALPRDLTSWLRALAVQAGRPAPLIPYVARPPAPSAEDEALTAHLAHAVHRALAALPGRCPELLAELAASPELTYRELADRLGLPRGSIGPTRSRCLGCLRTLLYGLRPE